MMEGKTTGGGENRSWKIKKGGEICVFFWKLFSYLFCLVFVCLEKRDCFTAEEEKKIKRLKT